MMKRTSAYEINLEGGKRKRKFEGYWLGDGLRMGRYFHSGAVGKECGRNTNPFFFPFFFFFCFPFKRSFKENQDENFKESENDIQPLK